jgi:hypothetical protein
MHRTRRIHVPAAPIIDRVSRDLNYSRAHVAKILRDNATALEAKLENRRWYVLEDSERGLRTLVRQSSGHRYKLGERGPHA